MGSNASDRVRIQIGRPTTPVRFGHRYDHANLYGHHLVEMLFERPLSLLVVLEPLAGQLTPRANDTIRAQGDGAHVAAISLAE